MVRWFGPQEVVTADRKCGSTRTSWRPSRRWQRAWSEALGHSREEPAVARERDEDGHLRDVVPDVSVELVAGLDDRLALVHGLLVLVQLGHLGEGVSLRANRRRPRCPVP